MLSDIFFIFEEKEDYDAKYREGILDSVGGPWGGVQEAEVDGTDPYAGG